MTDRERRRVRKQTNERVKKCREKKKQMNDTNNSAPTTSKVKENVKKIRSDLQGALTVTYFASPWF